MVEINLNLNRTILLLLNSNYFIHFFIIKSLIISLILLKYYLINFKIHILFNYNLNVLNFLMNLIIM